MPLRDNSGAKTKLDDALDAAIQANMPPGTMMTSWALVLEYMDENGEPDLYRTWSRDLPWWRRDGMMHASLFGGNEWVSEDGES